VADLRQNRADVIGVFDLVEVNYSGGDVTATVDTGTEEDTLGSLRAYFSPNDLGTPFVVDTKITSPDGGRFAGAFVFGTNGVVGHGNATFTRVQ
jgi:hypothetical protein